MHANYHGHVDLCKHASGTCEEVVLEAIKHNFKEIGISDHLPKDRIDDNMFSMNENDLLYYSQTIDKLKDKYKNEIIILKGMECEYTPELIPLYEHLLNDLNFDYLILGHHFTKVNDSYMRFHFIETLEDMHLYADSLVTSLNTGYFKYLAHPDLFLLNYTGSWSKDIKEISRKIIENCIENDVYIELNANGFRRKKILTEEGLVYPYPRLEFWQLVAEYDAKVIIGSDHHTIEQLNDDAINKAKEMLDKLGITCTRFIL